MSPTVLPIRALYNPCLRRATVHAPCPACRLHVTNGYRQRSAGPAQARNTKLACVHSSSKCRELTRSVLHGMRVVPRKKNLHRTICHPRIIPQVTKIFRCLVPASTNRTGSCVGSSDCVINHRVRKILTSSPSKVITFFSHFWENHLTALFGDKKS